MKRIVIDSYPISVPHSGLGEFCIQIGRVLSKLAPELQSKYGIELYFILPPKFEGFFGNGVKYICIPAAMRWIIPFYPFRADLFHIPYQCGKIKCMYFAKKQLLTIHDINFVYERRGRHLKRSVNRLKRRLCHSDYLSYISKFAYEDTKRHFDVCQPYKIIYNGVSDLSANMRDASLPAGLPESFLFHISSLLPKKNIHLLIDMMEYLPDQNLVIAGNWDNDYASRLMQKVKDENRSNIYLLPNVTEEEKIALYDKCRALLFPSLCEGFGLPPIEAMKFGKPVFLSTLTSLPEVGGDAAFYWEELSPPQMANILRNKLSVYDNDSEYPDRLRQNAARFQWDKCVTEYINYYLEILNLQ